MGRKGPESHHRLRIEVPTNEYRSLERDAADRSVEYWCLLTADSATADSHTAIHVADIVEAAEIKSSCRQEERQDHRRRGQNDWCMRKCAADAEHEVTRPSIP